VPSLTGVDFLASPCVPSPVSAIRTPNLPLLPLWEKGVGGMRGKGAQECRTSLISPKNSTLERRAVGVKPSAIQGKARLRGLARNNYSTTIISVYAPRLRASA